MPSSQTRQIAEVVHALERKVQVLAELLHEAGRIARPSRRLLALSADVSYDTLKAAWAVGAATPSLQQKLGLAGQFDTQDPRWCDRDTLPASRSLPPREYGGRDTEANFRAMLRRGLGLGADFFSRVRGDKPTYADANLATFSVDDAGQATASGESSNIFLHIIIEPGYYDHDIVFGFRRARLRLQFEDASGARVERRLGADTAVEFGNAQISSIGREYDAHWLITAQIGSLQGEFATQDGPLCQIAGMAIGEPFWAELAVRPADGSLILPPTLADVSITKQRIIQSLITSSVSDSDSQGWITLGRQQLRLVRADQL